MALASVSRFLIHLHLGPRTLESAAEMLASVAACCGPAPPLLLLDNHRPYPAAILQVFGVVQHRRRRRRRGRRKHPRLKAPAGLLAGVVHKVRDEEGKLLRVRTGALFGRRKEICRRIRQLKLGQQINTGHIERCNGTMRCQQTRLTRRPQTPSRRRTPLRHALYLWRDLYNWVRPHAGLQGRTPAMAQGLAQQPWTLHQYVTYPVHVSDLQRQLWAEERENLLTPALPMPNVLKSVPTS